MSLAGRSLLITGAASGIGLHLAGQALQRGARVLAADINLDALTQHSDQQGWPPARTRLVRLDVRDPAAWAAAVDQAVTTFGGLDVALNVAGFLTPGWLLDLTPDSVHRQMDINTKGVIFGTQAAARHMVQAGRGHIVNIASLAALAPVPGLSIYSASKYAVRSFSLAAAEELRPHGVSLTVVCPDAVQTPMLDLQKDRAEAAMTFSGPRTALTVEDLGRAILGRVLERRPLELYLPWHRGALARFADLFPGAIRLLLPSFRRKGLARQAQLRKPDAQP